MAGLSSSKALRGDLITGTANTAQSERLDMWTAMPGRIKTFNPQKQTATVEVLYKPRHDGKPVEMPDLLEVPVKFPRGGGAALTWPIKPGDGVQIVFQSRAMDAWYGQGGAQEAPSARMHDLSDAVAIPGLVDSTKALANFNGSHMQLRSENGQNAFTFDQETGRFSMVGKDGEELITILFDLLAILETATTTVNFGSSAGIHPLTQQPGYGALKARLAKIKLA